MQLLAEQTSLEPLLTGGEQGGPRAVREPGHHAVNGSRFASEPASLSARESQIPELPRRDLSKLPIPLPEKDSNLR